MSYSGAQDTCRQKGAELLTNKIQNRTIIPSSGSVWLSARRSKWKHASLAVGFVFLKDPSWPSSVMCTYVNTSTQLKSMPTDYCEKKLSVICMIENTAICDGYVFDYRCYFLAENGSSEMSFYVGNASCRAAVADMVVIYSQEQIDWLVKTFSKPFWTGYISNEDKEYYWPDGSAVPNVSVDHDLGDCMQINRYGDWEQTDCRTSADVVCTLDVPYAAQRNVSCETFGAECVCYWAHNENKRFNEAMATCMSEGGTLFYPNSEEKLASNRRDSYWIGVSQGNTRGVFRGSDSSVIKWAKWTKFPPNFEKDCVSIKNQEFCTEDCDEKLPYICQSPPDPELYPCNQGRGCLGAYDFWNIENSCPLSMDLPEIVVRNVDAFEKCWEICVNYIGFVCLFVTYNITSEECQLSKEISGQWDCDTTSDLLSRNRTRKIVDPDSYCMISMDKKTKYTSAISTCKNYGRGWTFPVIRDEEMQNKFAEIKKKSWISAKMKSVGVFFTFEGEYIPYSYRSLSQSGDMGNEICVSSNEETWYITDCTNENNVICFANIEYVCVDYPNITNGTVLSYTNKTVHYICDENYFLPGINESSYQVECTCDWNQKLEAVRNCTAIECPKPGNSTNGIVSEVTGVKINDTVIYQCPEGYKVNGTDLIYYNLTCELTSRTTAMWSAPPDLEAISCPQPPNTTNGTITAVTGVRFNDNVTYKCPEGYKVNGTDLIYYNLTCELTSRTTAMWSAPPDLEAMECTKPKNSTMGTVIHITGLRINDTVLYECPTGHIVSETHLRFYNRTCNLTSNKTMAMWTDYPKIIAIVCADPPDIPNARKLTSSTTIGGIAKYSCVSGYRVVEESPPSSEFEITCLLNDDMESAEWSKRPVCEAMVCSKAPTISNGEVQVDGYGLGDTAMYTCKPHYRIHLEGSASAVGLTRTQESVCTLDPIDGLVWRPVPTCISEDEKDEETPLVRQCPPPTKIKWATAHYKDTFINSVVTYVTDPGYKFSDGTKERSMICLPNGQWGSYTASAKRERCPQINVIGATKSTEDNVPGTMVTITCNDNDAKMENGLRKTKIKCTHLGKWSSYPKSCKVKRCGPFPYIERSRLISFNNTVNGLAELECIEGTSFADGHAKKYFKCLSHLDWEEPGKCLVNRCPRLSVPEHSKISTDIVVVGTVVEVTCLRGYMFPDRSISKRITCELNHQWNETLPDCETLRCPDPQRPEHCFVSEIKTLFNSNITYQCETPYRMEYGYTEMTIRCQEDGRWTYDSLTCSLGRCPPVPEVQNAVPDTRLAINGTTVLYTCDEGHTFSNTNSYMYAYCNGSAWNTTETECSKIKCPQLNLTHATYTQQGSSFGDVLEFSCDEGYHYDNKTTGALKCGANSQWSPNMEGCRLKDCGPPPEMKYSTRNIPVENVYGAVVTYNCLPRYWIKQGVRNASIACTKFGTWSNASGVCKLITCPVVPVWDDIEVNTTDNVVGTAINISCSTREDEMKTSFVLSRCTSNGTWVPPLHTCKGKHKKVVDFEPEPEEAKDSKSIGAIIITCMVLVFLPMVISDIPNIVRAFKGKTILVKNRKRRQLKWKKKK